MLPAAPRRKCCRRNLFRQTYKGVRVPFGGEIQLYNLKDDPGEQHDIAAQHAGDIVPRIAAIMRQARTPSERWKLPHEK